MADTTLAQKALLHLRVTNELLKRADARNAQLQQKQAAYAAKIPVTVEALLAGERIYDSEKQAVAKALEDPGQCMDLLAKLAYHRSPSEVATLGKSAADVASSSPTITPRYVGEPVYDWDDTVAGRRFREILGVPLNT